MKRLTLVALLILTPLFVVACGGGDAKTTTTTTAPQVGNPDPPLPIDINTIPYKPSDLVALGNA